MKLGSARLGVQSELLARGFPRCGAPDIGGMQAGHGARTYQLSYASSRALLILVPTKKSLVNLRIHKSLVP